MIAAHCLAAIVIFSDLQWRQSALRLADELASPSACVLHIGMPGVYSNSSVTWGEPGYFSRIRHRLPTLRRILANNTTLSTDSAGWLAMFDADIVVLRNVTSRFSRLFRDNPAAHLLVQQEWPCQSAPLRPCVNGGLWAVRRSPQALTLLERAEALIDQLRISDQSALDIVAASTPTIYLDRLRYANGYTMLYEPRWQSSGAHLVHVNWLFRLECKLQWLGYFRATRFHSTEPGGVNRSRCGVSFVSTS